MQDLKTGLFLADNDQTRRVLPQTSADIVEILSSAGEASNVQAEISSLRTAKLSTPAVGGSAGQVLSLDESGNTVWKADEKGDTLPSVSSATAGQVLKVNSAVNGTEWGDVPKELPEQLGTSGQVLAVNSAASGVEWKTPESGLPAIGTAGQVLAVNSDATGAEWKTPEAGLPAIGSASAGDLLAVNSTANGVEFVKPAFYTKTYSQLTVLSDAWTSAGGAYYYVTKNLDEIFTEINNNELITFCKKIICVYVCLEEENLATEIMLASATLAFKTNPELLVAVATKSGMKPSNTAKLHLKFLIKN